MLALIRGAGDIASGAAMRLWRCGIDVVMTDLARPTAIRRTVAFSDAIVHGETTVEGLRAVRAENAAEAKKLLREGSLPVLADPECACREELAPDALVDAILAKRNLGTKIDDAPIFKRKPIFEQFTVSLSCLNPFWREETETREDIATWIGGFEFPVPDGLELYDGWEIGYRQPSLIVNVYNSGDVKSGIRIEFRAIGAVTNPVLLNVDTREFIKLNISLVAGDVLTVSTGYGEKAVKLNRGGTITDAFRYLDVDSSYLQIAVGDNLFRYSADANAENLEVSIYHNNLYLGV